MAPSSNGQDTRFSSWQQGFDSPRGHHVLLILEEGPTVNEAKILSKICSEYKVEA